MKMDKEKALHILCAGPDHISGNAAFDEFYMSAKEEGNNRDNVSDALI